jgi:hypothetical protein
MKSESFLILLRAALLVAAATLMSQPVLAQQPLFLFQIPASESGSDPIAFMRPHFFVHQAAGASLRAAVFRLRSVADPARLWF